MQDAIIDQGPDGEKNMVKPHTIIAVLSSLPSVLHAAADLPPGNCATPQAATDLSQCDFSRKKMMLEL